MNSLYRFRAEIDDFMAHHPQSPLNAEQRGDFQGLNYYESNMELRLEVKVQRLPTDEPLIDMPTSTGDSRKFRRWGRFSFAVDGEQAELTIYANPYEGDFFLPFRDGTSGKETYGAGRYLDSHRPGLRQVDADTIEIDFNYTYNPYCVYSSRYSCPLPPAENWVKVKIEAGEKNFVVDG